MELTIGRNGDMLTAIFEPETGDDREFISLFRAFFKVASTRDWSNPPVATSGDEEPRLVILIDRSDS